MFFLKNDGSSKSFKVDSSYAPRTKGKFLYLFAFFLFATLTIGTLMIGFAAGFTNERLTLLMLNGWFAVCTGEILRRFDEPEKAGQSAPVEAENNELQEAYKELKAERESVSAPVSEENAQPQENSEPASQQNADQKDSSGKAA